MTPAESLLQKCTQFTGPDKAAFHEIVAGIVGLPGVLQKDLARDWEVDVSTVGRWANGGACPGKHVQSFVVKRVKSRIQPTTLPRQ